MSLLQRLKNLFEDPPPPLVFEISESGLAWAALDREARAGFTPVQPGALQISPVDDNVKAPEALTAALRNALAASGVRRKETAVILPDYCARIAVLDFESFPSDPGEQLALVRFRMRKTVPFDLDAASIGYHVRPGAGSGKHYEVVAAAAAVGIVARYEACFRSAGLVPGFITLSSLAAIDLLPPDGITVSVKLGGRVLAITVAQGRQLKLLRCVELDQVNLEEVMQVLFPTFAFAEDELPERPARILLCGFNGLTEPLRQLCESELAVATEPLRAALALPTAANAGLLGYLQANGAASVKEPVKEPK
jgi:type IV pilus assembly protein PilM